MTGPGHNSTDDRLRLLLERIERLEEEKKGIADDIRDVYGEGKAVGYDCQDDAPAHSPAQNEARRPARNGNAAGNLQSRRGAGLMEGGHIQDQRNLQKMQITPFPVHPEPSRPQAEQSRDTLPPHIEALHEQANRWDERGLRYAEYCDREGGPLPAMEKEALRYFQLAEHLRRLATRLTVEQVTEGADQP